MKMPILNFPKFDFRFKSNENGFQIFDVVRKKFVVLQPEEWVRQHTVLFILKTLKYPKSFVNVEKKMVLNNITKRSDILVFNPDGSIKILVECKAPEITIDQNTFDQIARYNIIADAEYLMVTNGISHFYCQMDYENKKYTFIPELPEFSR